MQQVFPHVAFRREVTVGHLLLDTSCECAVHAKVNPPIRPREDVEALWQAVLDRKVDWIVSDHACCSAEQKWSKDDPSNIWLAKSGFGGTEHLLSAVLSEGSRRGMSYNHIAELVAAGTLRSVSACSARAISHPVTTPTLFSSIRIPNLWSAPQTPNPIKVIRLSKALSSRVA